MENFHSPVIFDSKSKEWFNPTPVPENLKVLNLGEIILKKLNEISPQKVIETNANTGNQTTASDMKSLVINIAINLQKMSIQQGDIVILFCSMTPLTTPLIYACLVIGAIYVIFDTHYTDEIIQYMLELVEPSLIVYGNEYHDRLMKIMNGLAMPKLKNYLSFESREDKNSLRQKIFDRRNSNVNLNNFQPPYLGDPQINIATFIFTSGTTGRPKLMAHTHSFLAYGVYYCWDVNESSIIYVASSLRTISQNASIFHPIFFNCSRIYATVLASPEFCAKTIKKYKVTHFCAAGPLVKKILGLFSDKNGMHLTSLEAIYTSERFSKSVIETLKHLNPNCIVCQTYGLAETAGAIGKSFEIVNKKFGYTIVPGIKIRILEADADDGTLLSPNQNGIISIKGPVEFGPYWKNKKFNLNSFTEDGWFITGDYGKFDENNELFVYNRYKDLIRCEEHIIIPSLLEILLEDHPLLETCYIVSIPYEDRMRGEYPVAFCKLNHSKLEKSKLSLDQAKEDIKQFIIERLPSNLVPPSEIFLQDEFPFTSGGKIDRRALRSSIVDKLVEK